MVGLLQGASRSALCSYFKFDFVSFIPIIGKAMAVPELSDLFRRASFGNRRQLRVIIFVHNVFARYYPCIERSS